MVTARHATAVLLLVLLAGCSKESGAQDAVAKLDQAAEAVPVEATRTTGVIRGVVVDDALRPLAGALVQLQSSGRNVTTAAEGTFGFQGVEPGVHFLTVGRRGYSDVQQSVVVEAGVDDPDVVRILLAASDVATPSVDAYETRIITDFEFCVDVIQLCSYAGGVVSNPGNIFGAASHRVGIQVSPNATVVQSEAHWSETSPLARYGLYDCYTYEDGFVDRREAYGTTALAVRVNATGVVDEEWTAAESFVCDWEPRSGGGIPVGLAYGQLVDTYTHVFYAFTPREDWQFGRDGDYPVPPPCTPEQC